MEQIKLYWSNLNKHIFTNESKFVCKNCSEDIERICYYVYEFWKREIIQKFYCVYCIDKAKMNGFFIEEKVILITNKLPVDAIPFIITKPILSNVKNLDVFEAAERQIKHETIIDKTKYAGRESWEGSTIGIIDKNLLDSKDSELRLNDGIKLLTKHKNK